MKLSIKPCSFKMLFLAGLLFAAITSCQKEYKQMPAGKEQSVAANKANSNGHLTQRKPILKQKK